MILPGTLLKVGLFCNTLEQIIYDLYVVVLRKWPKNSNHHVSLSPKIVKKKKKKVRGPPGEDL